MIETRAGLRAAMGCDRTKAAYHATPVSFEDPARDAVACVATRVAAGARARSTPLRCDVA